MSVLKYFDAHAVIGQRPAKPPRARWSTEHLLEDMDLAEISGALVMHEIARGYDVLYGNARLHDELKKSPRRLFGTWCIGPIGGPGFHADGNKMIESMEVNNIRAVRLVPGGFSLHQEVMGPTFEILQHHGVLLLLEPGWAGHDFFSFFHDLLKRYPHLPVLLTDHRWDQQRHSLGWGFRRHCSRNQHYRVDDYHPSNSVCCLAKRTILHQTIRQVGN